MELGSPLALASLLFLGLLSLALFLYGKKNAHVPSIGASIILGVVPMFLHSLLVIWAIAIVTLGGLFMVGRSGE
jgi:ABC-type Co2+ transport system permease subunit